MNLLKKILISSFSSELNKIYQNEQITNKTINNFYVSFLNFTFFLKLLIGTYLIITSILNFFIVILFFFKFRLNYFENIHKVLKKLPILKNIQNFLIANLLLHTDQ
jgi:hypothetical protein